MCIKHFVLSALTDSEAAGNCMNHDTIMKLNIPTKPLQYQTPAAPSSTLHYESPYL